MTSYAPETFEIVSIAHKASGRIVEIRIKF